MVRVWSQKSLNSIPTIIYRDLKQAINCLESALKLDKVPNKQVIMKTLVIAYEKISNFVAARDVLTDYVNLYPEDEEAARELTFLETR